MRKVFGWITLVLGFLFIFLAPFVRFYTFPRVQKVPTDVDERVTAAGFGSYLRIKDFTYVGPVPLTDVQRLKGLPDNSTEDVSVINSFHNTRDGTKTVDYIPEVYVLDRTSSLPVRCCGVLPSDMQGYTLKLPFDAQKIKYPWWDPVPKRAFPARYIGEDTIDGVKVYEYRSVGDNVVVDPDVGVPGSYVHQDVGTFHAELRYRFDTKIWVEPTTGALIKGSQHAARWFADPATGDELAPASDTTLTWTPRYVADTASDVKTQASQLKLVKVYVPIFGPILGIALVVVGVLLLRQKPEKKPAGTTGKATKTTVQPAEA